MNDSDRLFREYERRQEAERRAYAFRSARFVRQDRGPVSGGWLTLTMAIAGAALVGFVVGHTLVKAIANLATVNVGL